MQVNDVVIFTENGSDHVATVLEVRELEHHNGTAGEPLLHLGFFAPVFRPGPNGKPSRVPLVGTHQQNDLVQFRLDVAHESHKFDPNLKKPLYPGGRWRNLGVPEPVEESTDLAISDHGSSGSVN